MQQNPSFVQSINQTKAVEEKLYEMEDIPLLDMQDEFFPTKIVETFKRIGFAML